MVIDQPNVLEQIDSICDSFEAAAKRNERLDLQNAVLNSGLEEEYRSVLVFYLIQLDANYTKANGNLVDWTEYHQIFPAYKPQVFEAQKWVLKTSLEDELRKRVEVSLEDHLASWNSNDDVTIVGELVEVALRFLPASQRSQRIDQFVKLWPELLDSPYVNNKLEDDDVSNSENAKEHLELPDRIGKYEILYHLGSGGQGDVFLAFDEDLQTPVAIKRFSDTNGAEVEAFRSEAHKLVLLNHPNIVKVHGVHRNENSNYIVLEYAFGRALTKTSKLPPSDAANLVRKLADAVDYMHRRDICHLDLKPSNIIVDDLSNPKIIDFGLSLHRLMWTNEDRIPRIRGTLEYMAPEQATGDVRALTPQTDVFGLGAILYRLLTGKPLYERMSQEEVFQCIGQCDFDREALKSCDIPTELADICYRCLSRSPEDRFQSAADLSQALDGICEPTSTDDEFDLASMKQRNAESAARLVGSTKLFAFMVAAMLTFSLVGFAVSLSANKSSSNTEPAAPWNGQINVLVERNDQNGKKRLFNLNEAGALPMRADDKFRIEGELDSPAYLYLVWVEPNHDITPVFPWDPKAGWESRPAKQLKQSRISLPPNRGKLYTVPDAKDGIATVVLFATSTPLDVPDEVICSWFQQLPELELPAGAENAVVWFENYLEVRTTDRLRTFGEVGADDLFAQWQGKLQEVLEEHAEFQASISFARVQSKNAE